MNNLLSKCGAVAKRSTAMLSFCCAAMLCLFGMTSVASAQVVLPDPGVDVAGHVTAAIVALGAIVVIAIGGYFAYAVIKFGLRWSSKAAG